MSHTYIKQGLAKGVDIKVVGCPADNRGGRLAHQLEALDLADSCGCEEQRKTHA